MVETILEIQNLSRYFGALAAINALELKVFRGSITALIGPNGAGKSTLFNLITGNINPSSGKIIWKGRDITALPPHRISKMGIARSYQVTNIFSNLTTLENVQFAVQSRKRFQNPFLRASGLRDVSERAYEILDLLGLDGKEHDFGGNLSHGDQRRLEIAISLATSPELLLMDEPTAGMSPAETDEMIALIPRISKDLTIVIVEHDMKVVMKLAQTISVLYYGEIIAEGTPEEIRNNKRVLEVYLGGDFSG